MEGRSLKTSPVHDASDEVFAESEDGIKVNESCVSDSPEALAASAFVNGYVETTELKVCKDEGGGGVVMSDDASGASIDTCDESKMSVVSDNGDDVDEGGLEELGMVNDSVKLCESTV